MKKVARLESVRKGTLDAAPVVLPRPLDKVQQRTTELLARLLAEMLDGADDRLFDLAESAAEGERDRYFDAMRELRVKRAGLETGFRQALHNSFRTLAVDHSGGVLGSPDFDMDSLALVNEDEVEIGVAIDNMARKARGGCDEQLRIFNHRLEYLFEGRHEFGERRNPLEPRQVAECFRLCVDKLELDIRSVLIVLKLFERMVLAEIGPVVAEANQYLIDAGILPEIKAPPIRPVRGPAGRAYAPAAAAVPGQAAGSDASAEQNQMFGLLQELLSALRPSADGSPVAAAAEAGLSMSAMPAIPAMPGSFQGPGNIAVMHNDVPVVNGVPLAPGTQVAPVGSSDLVHLLSRLQRLEASLEARAHAAVPEEIDVRAELASLLETDHGSDSVHALEQADDDVINLVSMLFDFILDDQGLATEIKALIGRLQIPLLKVAISDKGFFSNDEHPARQLLNLLARAGAQWSPAQGMDDELYRAIEEAVFRILNDYDDDAALFGELLHEFGDFFQRQVQHTERVEARIREVEEGRARAEAARAAVAQALDQRLAGRALPALAVRLLREGWQQVLYLTCLRDGEQGEAWARDVRVVDAVIWSVLPHREQAALKRLEALSPKLLNSLRQGLERISYDALEMREMLIGLQALHQQLLQGLDTAREVVKPEPVPAPAPAPTVAEAEQLPEDHPQLRALRGMRPGQWVEFVDEDGQTQRCRLAANLRQGSKLVFINRRGIKVCEHSAMTLALALQQGSARLVEDGALFDRALEAVIGDLRKRQGAGQR